MSWSPSSCILLISVYLQPVCDHGSLLFPFSCWLKQLLIFAITPFPRSTKITSQLTRRFLLNLFHSISPMSVKFPKPVFLIMRSRKINAFSDFTYQHFSCSLFLELPYWPRFFLSYSKHPSVKPISLIWVTSSFVRKLFILLSCRRI